MIRSTTLRIWSASLVVSADPRCQSSGLQPGGRDGLNRSSTPYVMCDPLGCPSSRQIVWVF